MSKRKSTGADKTPSKDKMDVDGEDSGSDDVGFNQSARRYCI